MKCGVKINILQSCSNCSQLQRTTLLVSIMHALKFDIAENEKRINIESCYAIFHCTNIDPIFFDNCSFLIFLDMTITLLRIVILGCM